MTGAYAKEAVSSTREEWDEEKDGLHRQAEEPTAGRSLSAQPIVLERERASTFRLGSPRHSGCHTTGPDAH
jgi:hypothetical protein